ncbi:MAG: macro domain-containing protein [Alphaproteobacteria bacterium]
MNGGIQQRLQAIEADITTLAVDAIVNAANAALMPGGGVDGAIRRKAGLEMDAALYRIGRCEPGDAVLTEGFALPARYVVHTVAPIWSPGENRAELERILARCYESVLRLAGEHGISTIGFPAIGTGAYGWPADRAANIAVTTVRRELRGRNSGMEVTFCCFSETDLSRYQALIGAVT